MLKVSFFCALCIGIHIALTNHLDFPLVLLTNHWDPCKRWLITNTEQTPNPINAHYPKYPPLQRKGKISDKSKNNFNGEEHGVEGKRGTWIELWKMPPTPMPSLKKRLMWRMVLLAFSDPLLVTSYTCATTSFIIVCLFLSLSSL